MIIMSSRSGARIEIEDAPKITYDGEWLSWRPEFYDGVLYWEAWLTGSGTLTVEDGRSYVGDAWGIGGGGQAPWSVSGANNATGTAGIPNMRSGIKFENQMAVTIGEGGSNAFDGKSDPTPGGDTKLADILTCQGGKAPDGQKELTDTYKRYRFEDPDKAAEAGLNGVGTINGKMLYAQGGWMRFRRTVTKSYSGTHETVVTAQGDGFGAGSTAYGWASPGALVIRIPA